MRGAARLMLDPPKAGPGPISGATRPMTIEVGAVQHTTDGARVVTLPPQLTYAPNMGK